jgi:hypothetical protein
MSQVAECLRTKLKVLSSHSSTAKKRKNYLAHLLKGWKLKVRGPIRLTSGKSPFDCVKYGSEAGREIAEHRGGDVHGELPRNNLLF